MLKTLIFTFLLIWSSGCGRTAGNNNTSGINNCNGSNGNFSLQIIDNNATFKNGHFQTIIRVQNRPSYYNTLSIQNDPFAKKDNYSLSENGKIKDETKIAVLKESNTPNNNILLLLDLSGSIKYDNDTLNKLRITTENFIRDFQNENSKTKIGIYFFDSRRDIMNFIDSGTFTNNYDYLLNQIVNKLDPDSAFLQKLYGYNATNLYGAIKDSLRVFCEDQTRCTKKSINSVIIITDGSDTASIVTYNEMLKSLKTICNNNDYKNIDYFALGIGNTAIDVLKKIAKDCCKFKFFPGRTDTLSKDLKLLFNAARNNNNTYIIKYCPSTQIGNIDVKLIFKDKKTHLETEKFQINLNMHPNFRCDL